MKNSDSTYVYFCHLLMAHQLTLKGKLAPEFKEAGVEAFRGKHRLPGSNASDPLEDELVDADT